MATNMCKNGGTDIRPIEWLTWCAKMAELIEMLGRLVLRHPDTIDSQTRYRYNIHPHMLYRPIEWPPWCGKTAEPIEMLAWRHYYYYYYYYYYYETSKIIVS